MDSRIGYTLNISNLRQLYYILVQYLRGYNLGSLTGLGATRAKNLT